MNLFEMSITKINYIKSRRPPIMQKPWEVDDFLVFENI
jgi:hypothetical protein